MDKKRSAAFDSFDMEWQQWISSQPLPGKTQDEMIDLWHASIRQLIRDTHDELVAEIERLRDQRDRLYEVVRDVSDSRICSCYDDYGRKKPTAPCVICRAGTLLMWLGLENSWKEREREANQEMLAALEDMEADDG